MNRRARFLDLLHRLLRVPPPEPVVVIQEVAAPVTVHRLAEYGYHEEESTPPTVVPAKRDPDEGFPLPPHTTLQ